MPGPDHPPGYYGPSGAARALNLITAGTALTPIRQIDAAGAVSGYTMKKPVALEPWFDLAALALFPADVLAVLRVERGLAIPPPASRRPPPILLAAALLLLLPADVRAQATGHPAPGETLPLRRDDFALKASLQTRLAYVITGDADIDRTSRKASPA